MSADIQKIKDILHKDWTVTNQMIWRTFSFNDFIEAMQFVNTVAAVAEEANHHPEINISYNTVTLVLTTHDAGGVTEKDSLLAAKIDSLK